MTGLSPDGRQYSLAVAAVNSAGASALATLFDVQTQDQPPTVNAPTAAANPVTGTSTTLSVVATDDGGAGNLTYLVVGTPRIGARWYAFVQQQR